MATAKELRDQLRAARKLAMKPVSKMRMVDIASELAKLQMKRETMPHVAQALAPALAYAAAPAGPSEPKKVRSYKLPKSILLEPEPTPIAMPKKKTLKKVKKVGLMSVE